MMNDLLLDIYSVLMKKDEDALEMQKCINTEMERLIIPYKNQLTEEEMEKLRYLLYDTIDVTREKATFFGMKLIFRLFLGLQ